MTRTVLGKALLEAGRAVDALPHLRFAVTANPFDCNAARALDGLLGEPDQVEERNRLRRSRLLLARVAPQVVPLEDWFALPDAGKGVLPDTSALPAEELASIVILCCNELDYTRLCLESILHHTREPYELLIVDNGSTDETPAYLNALRGKAGPARVHIIRNEKNVGFPAGVNQALPLTRGEYVVLLNNDTVLTPSWLEGLVREANDSGPPVGLVGPMTNYAGGVQKVDARYTTLAGLDAFAAERRASALGQWMWND